MIDKVLPRIALCAIVKDEAHTLPRLAKSLEGIIDYWVIVDTGSSDDTISVAKQAFSYVPGEIHEREWVNFGHNRSELMSIAKGKAEWLLTLDADDVVEGFIPDSLDLSTNDAYLLNYDLGFANWVPRLVRGDLDWVYSGPVHEYIHIKDGPFPRRSKLVELVIKHFGDGGVRHIGGISGRQLTLDRDKALLEHALVDNPDDSRSWFYMGQTYYELGMYEDALRAYSKRVELGGWDEEVYYSKYRVGELLDILKRSSEALEVWLAAWESRPHRLETLHAVVKMLRLSGRYHTAYALADSVADAPLSEDILFVHDNVWRYELPLEHSICAYYVKGPQACLDESETLLKQNNLPPHIKNCLKSNISLSRRVLGIADDVPVDDTTAVIVPVMLRPQNAAPFMESFNASGAPSATVYAVCDVGDTQTIEAWRSCGAKVIERITKERPGTYAEKVNFGFRYTSEPWIAVFGDDVKFHAGWLEEAHRVAADTGAKFVGINDLGNPEVLSGEHATQMLIARSYVVEQGASWDRPGVVCHEGYRHWYVDNEMVVAAKQRGVWASALSSVVEHMHPIWGKGEDDEVYRLGQSFAKEDSALFLQRKAEFLVSV